MIDVMQELQNFSPIKLEDMSKDYPVIPDNVKNSIALYNKALDDIHMKNEDMAIIQLKKAIAMNPDFCEAINLLGICYVYVRDHTKAAEMFEKVAAIEKNGISAVKYVKQLNEGNGSETGKRAKKTVRAVKPASESPVAIQKKDTPLLDTLNKVQYGLKFDMVKYAAALILGALLMLLLGTALNLFSKSEETPKTGTNLQSTPTPSVDYKSNVPDYNETVKQLQSDLNKANQERDYYKSIVKLSEVQSLIDNGKYQSAADILLSLEAIKFNDDEKKVYNSMRDEIMPKAAVNAYGAGVDYFNSGNYQKALEVLQKVERFDENCKYMDGVLYYIGKSNEQLGNKDDAIKAFQRVIDKYPGSRFAGWSESKMRNILKNN